MIRMDSGNSGKDSNIKAEMNLKFICLAGFEIAGEIYNRVKGYLLNLIGGEEMQMLNVSQEREDKDLLDEFFDEAAYYGRDFTESCKRILGKRRFEEVEEINLRICRVFTSATRAICDLKL